MQTPIIRLVTCGSVDDGKSTLIGRLLVETDSVPHDTVATARTIRRTGSTVPIGEVDFSLLTDGLEAEREQGITIDVAYRSMSLFNGKRLIFADAPGHEQYTRNMAVAASRADIALILIDSTQGIRTQTLRHLAICSLMQVHKVIVVVNKMDLVEYSIEVFQEIISELQTAAKGTNIIDFVYIPVSALVGDNVVNKSVNMPWYSGSTLLESIQNRSTPKDIYSKPHLGIQLVVRTEKLRGVSGTVLNGTFFLGDEIVVLPSQQKAIISEIITFDGNLESAGDSEAVTLVLKPDVDATRGDSIELASNFSRPINRFHSSIVWLGESQLSVNNSYLLISGATQVPIVILSIESKLELTTGKYRDAEFLSMNEIGKVEIATNASISLTTYSNNRYTGSFILVDRGSFNTVAAGMVNDVTIKTENIFQHDYEVNPKSKALQKIQTPKAIWLTGLSGSGKSTIANELEKYLFKRGMHTFVIDGDNLRLGLNEDLGFSRMDRSENVRRVSHVAKLMTEAGLIVIIALVSPFKKDRELARKLFERDTFIEVWIDTPLEVCKVRDPKGLYKKATSGEIIDFTGINQDYEPPDSPEIAIDGSQELSLSIAKILNYLNL